MPEVSLCHLCRKCLSKSRFWRRFFHLKKDDFGHFSTSKMASGKEAPGLLFTGARSSALCGPESKARALKTARPATQVGPEALDFAVSLTPRSRGLSQHPGTVSEACFSSLRRTFPCAEACHVRVSPLLHFGKDKRSVLRATCATAFTCAGLCLQLNSDRGFPWIVIAVRLQPLRPDGTRT